MRAVCWYGKQNVQVTEVTQPRLINPRDAVVRITSTAICGSDLHLYNGFIPTMHKGDILGHEGMGVVEQVGAKVANLKPGDRVVIPFAIACGGCGFCLSGRSALCDNSNPNAGWPELLYGSSGAGLFGYSHLYGGYAGAQAEYVRVPFADVGPLIIPPEMSDEKALLLSDILPTGYMAAEACAIAPEDTVAVWGCGPVGLMALLSAKSFNPKRLIAIDRFPERLALAAKHCGAVALNYEEEKDLVDTLRQMTGGEGPEACIDAVGLETHAPGLKLQADRPHALRQAIQACKKGGIISIPGVYGGWIDKIPFGAAFAKGLTLKMGQTHVHRYMKPLLEKILRGELDPSFVITHPLPLSEAAHAYQIFCDKQDGCVKVVLKP